MKKITIAVLAAIIVVAAAGGSFAWGGRGRMAPQAAAGIAPVMMRGMAHHHTSAGAAPVVQRGMMRGGTTSRGAMSIWSHIEIPQEIRDKHAEMQKLSIDMRSEMQKKPIDRAKIEEMYLKRAALRDELSAWRMKQKLDMIEKMQS